MATIEKRECLCPRAKKPTCSHRPHVVTYREPGGRKGRQVEVSFKRLGDAKDFAIKVENDKRTGTYIDPRKGQVPFSEVWDEWLAYGKLEESSKKTYEGMYRRHFEGYFARKPVAAITQRDVAKWETSEGRKYAASGVENRRGVLSAVFNYAIDTDVIGSNPCRRIRARRGTATTGIRAVQESEIPTPEEVTKIIGELPEWLALAGWLMAGCGLRRSESLAVCLTGFDREAKTLRVSHQIVRKDYLTEETDDRVKEGTKHRDIIESRKTPTPSVVLDALKLHEQRFGTWGSQGWLFESPMRPGTHPTGDVIDRAWRGALRATGLTGYTPKSFRHFFASQAIHAGVPVYEVAQWMGHRSTRTTEQVYAHITPGAYTRGADLLGAELRMRAGMVLA